MSKRRYPPEVMDEWFAAATHQPAIRADLASYALS